MYAHKTKDRVTQIPLIYNNCSFNYIYRLAYTYTYSTFNVVVQLYGTKSRLSEATILNISVLCLYTIIPANISRKKENVHLWFVVGEMYCGLHDIAFFVITSGVYM